MFSIKIQVSQLIILKQRRTPTLSTIMSPIVSITSLSAARFLNGIKSDSRMEKNELRLIKRHYKNLYQMFSVYYHLDHLGF